MKGFCCICLGPIEAVGGWAGGSNALPIADGRCCQNCDETIVIPTRVRRVYNSIGLHERARSVEPLRDVRKVHLFQVARGRDGDPPTAGPEQPLY
jgi:hypothetical protein